MKFKLNPYQIEQIRTTKALLKFCQDHGYRSKHLVSLKNCAEALEKEDVATAFHEYLSVPLGGNGCFNDWCPPVAFDHENEDYNWAVFDALVAQWSSMMKRSSDSDI